MTLDVAPPSVEARSLGDTARPALIASGVAALLMLIALFFDAAHVWRAYLMAWLDCLGIAMGSMMVVMMHHLTGGRWGWPIRRIGEASANTLPFVGLAFVPLLLGLKLVFPWANAAKVASDATLAHRAPLFGVGFVLGRVAFFLIIWSLIAWVLRRRSIAYDRAVDERSPPAQGRLSAGGLVLCFVTISLLAFDLIASREVDWYSSTFGLVTTLAQGLAGMSFCIMCLALLHTRGHLERLITERGIHDLGNLLQTSVILWAYVSFFQYLVIWIGDEQDDIVWFHHRTVGAWMPIGIAIIFLHFAAPFVMLLFQKAKRNLVTLGWIAAMVLAMRFVETLWSIDPSSPTATPGSVSWLDPVALVALGGMWWALFVWQLGRHSLVPREALEALEVYE